MLLSYCCHWKATPSEPSLHCFLSISMTGKILFPPKPTECFPLIFMQLGFCPRFVALKIKSPSVCEQLERTEHETVLVLRDGWTRAWNCACPMWWMADWLRTPQMSQQEEAAGLAEAMLLGFTLDFSGNSHFSSYGREQQIALCSESQSLNSVLLLVGIQASHLGLCFIHCLPPVWVISAVRSTA